MLGRRILTARGPGRRFEPVNLRDRGGGDGIGDVREETRGLGAELVLQGFQRLRFREGRDLVFQAREVGGGFNADDIGAGRHELAELDPGGAELFERAGEAFAGTAASAAAGQDAEDRAGSFRGERDARAIGVGNDHVIPHHDGAGAGEPQIVGQGGEHAYTAHPVCRAAMPPE